MSRWPRLQLEEFCTFTQGGRSRVTKANYIESGFPAFSAAGQDGFVANWEFDRPAIVLSSIGARCGKCFLAVGNWTSLANTYLIFPDLARAEPAYLWYLLDDELSWHRSGSAQPFIKPADIKSRVVPLPPVNEQRRIAAVLDRVNRIRRLRREALNNAKTLVPALFVEMFGDPAMNPKGWPIVPLRDLIGVGPMNGISPSSQGDEQRSVLTLSAITGDHFDSSAVKTGNFRRAFEPSRTVTRSLFLMCRGNGNKSLVGKGYFPSVEMDETYFPDTVIAFELRTDLIRHRYFEAFWNLGSTRQRIEDLAQTTNGTHKINQANLVKIPVAVPPISQQAAFEESANKIVSVRTALDQQAVGADTAQRELSQFLYDRNGVG